MTDVPKAKYSSKLPRGKLSGAVEAQRELSDAVERAAVAQHEFAVKLSRPPKNYLVGDLADLAKMRAKLLGKMFAKLGSGVVTLSRLETVATKLFNVAKSAYQQRLIAARQLPIAARQRLIAARQRPIARQRLIAARQLLIAVLEFIETTSRPHYAGEGSAVRSWAFALNSFCIFGDEMQETDTVRGVSSTAPAADAACFAHRT